MMGVEALARRLSELSPESLDKLEAFLAELTSILTLIKNGESEAEA
jgi:hypothetical protein